MNLSQITDAAKATTSSDEEDGAELNLPKAIVGAIVGALVLGVVYGVVGRFIAEYQFLALAVGAASGLAAVRLGGKATPVVGVVAAAASLLVMVAAKLIVGAPPGYTWIAYHLTPFDIAFCYLANPIVAFVAGGTGYSRSIISRLPF